jgi:hypothetical protein
MLRSIHFCIARSLSYFSKLGERRIDPCLQRCALESYFLMSPSACAEKPLPAKGECARYGYGLGIMKDEADPMGWGKNGHRRWSGVPQSLVFSPERLTGPFPYNAAIESVLFENGCDPLAMWSTQVGKATCMHTDVWVDTGQGKCSHDWGTVAAPVGKCSGAAPHTIGYLHLFTHDYFGFNVQMKDSQVHWESHTSDHPLKSTNGQYWSEAVRNKESQFFSSPQVTQLTPLQHTYNIHTYNVIQCTYMTYIRAIFAQRLSFLVCRVISQMMLVNDRRSCKQQSKQHKQPSCDQSARHVTVRWHNTVTMPLPKTYAVRFDASHQP